jgi:hypothetical protein
MIQASWHKRKFKIDKKHILTLEELSSSWGIITDTVETKHDEKIKVKGRSLQTVSFVANVNLATGIKPEAEMNAWVKLVGTSAPLYIGGRRFGPKYLMLKQCDGGDYILDNFGRIVSVALTLSFVEDRDGLRAHAKKKFGRQISTKLPKAVVKRMTANKKDKARKKKK